MADDTYFAIHFERCERDIFIAPAVMFPQRLKKILNRHMFMLKGLELDMTILNEGHRHSNEYPS